MAIGQTRMRIVNGGLGLTGPSASKVHVKIGPSASGTANALVSVGDPNTARTAFTAGPLPRSLGHAFGVKTTGRRIGKILAMKCATTTAGRAGDVRKAAVSGGTGTGTVTVAATSTGSINDRYLVRVEITAAGTVGTARFRYSLDDGRTWSREVTVPSGGTYAVAEAGFTLTFVPGAGTPFFEDGDVHYFRTVAPAPSTSDLRAAFTALKNARVEFFAAHIVGPPAPVLSAVDSDGTTPPTITLTGNPSDWWRIKVKCVLLGALATWKLQYSLDGGATYNGTDILSAATVLIPETGVTLNIAAGNAAVDNTWTFDSCNLDGLGDLHDEARADIALCEGADQYARVVIEAPRAADADLIALDPTLTDDPLVAIAGGFATLANALDTREELRSVAWPAVARLACIPPGELAEKVAAEACGDVLALDRDEDVTPGLDDARFITMRTIRGKSGYFIGGTPVRHTPTGDVTDLTAGRVIDAAERVGRVALLEFQGDDLVVQAGTGYIDELEAQRIDSAVRQAVARELEGQASAITVTTERDRNLTSDPTLNVAITVTPKGYARSIAGAVALGLVAAAQ